MRLRRPGRRAKPQPAAPATDHADDAHSPGPGAEADEPDAPGDPALDAALTDVVHRFLGLTDQDENQSDPLQDPEAPVVSDDAAGESEESASPPALPPARRRPQLRGRRRARGAPGGTPDGGTGPGRGTPRPLRRVVPAALLVAAVAVPGSGVLDGMTELMPGSASRSAESELALGGGGLPPIDDEPVSVEAFEDPEQLEAVPVGADPVSEPVQGVLEGMEVIEELGDNGIPAVARQAYDRAADRQGDDQPACGVRWSLLAAIGRVESNHGRFGGAQLRPDGYGTRRIRGIPLDGRPNVALIRDTDRGELDGDRTFDRAVGPMQFIPSTWRSVGVDANDDGRRDPNNMFDATQGAAGYLCAGGGDLRTLDDQARAVRRYNNADRYVRVVLGLARMYETGQVTTLPPLPALPGPAPLPQPQPTPAPDPDPGPGPTPTTAPRPSTPRPGGPVTTTPPRPVPSTTTTTAPPTTTTTVPPATSTTTIPPTTTVPTDPTAPTTTPPTTEAPAPPEPGEVGEPGGPPASVGWAPAMREVVVGILEGQPPAPAPTTAPTTVPPAEPSCEPPDADPAAGDDATGNIPEPPAGCTGEAPADAPAAPPAGAGEAALAEDPATVPTT